MLISPRPGIAAVILAGGQGTRMGGCEKPLLQLHNIPVLTFIMKSLRTSLPEHAIALSTNSNADLYAKWHLPLLRDIMPGCGPLGGLLTALLWARQRGAETLITVSGDTPFIPDTLVNNLIPAPAVVVSDKRRHHLIASWPVNCADSLQNWLGAPHNTQQRRVRLFTDTLNPREVVYSALPYDPFFNINTPDDYAAAWTLSQRITNHV